MRMYYITINSIKGKKNLAESMTVKRANRTNFSPLWSLTVTNKPNYNPLCETHEFRIAVWSIVIFSQCKINECPLIATTFSMQPFYFSLTWLDMFHVIKIAGNTLRETDSDYY